MTPLGSPGPGPRSVGRRSALLAGVVIGAAPGLELVSGPLAAETFPRKDGLLDPTFGPEVVFSKGNDSGRRQSPRDGNQFFGHVAIARDGLLTVTLYDGSGIALWTRDLEPEPVTAPSR